MKGRTILIVDAVVNLVLGLLLLMVVPFPERLPRFFGVPVPAQPFYPSLLGGVLVGIGIALLLECRRRGRPGLVGLGLGGAIAINLCGGILLIGWLIAGDLDLPPRGQAFLWAIAVILVVVSSVEWAVHTGSRS
jgi:hypothetical protein